MSAGLLIAIAASLVAAFAAIASMVAASRTRDALGEVRSRIDASEAQVRDLRDTVFGLQNETTKALGEVRVQQQEQLGQLTKDVTGSLQGVQTTVSEQLLAIRKDNTVSLEQMRATVDEKLQKTLNDRLQVSFGQVTRQLEEVNRGLGEMKSVAGDVKDLQKTLSNVKTRGILGEVQLGALLKEILTPEQYEENVATGTKNTERVEFAVRIPTSEGEVIYLPIDSKFPGDSYDHLRDAIDAGDKAAIEDAYKQLETTIKAEAKDISQKYLNPPHTTNFAIMFLPFEGLYAEVVNRPGLIEELQRTYRVNICGPSTMAALLNSVQMSLQSVAIQQRADEIQKILIHVQSEFPKYTAALRQAQKQVQTVDKSLDKLIKTRTNKMERALSGVEALGNPADALDEADGALLEGDDSSSEEDA